MSENQRLRAGDAAPEFVLPDQDEAEVRLSDFRGGRVVVYFYPAAGTPGCTTQACDFRDSLGDFGDAGMSVLGISPDAPAALARFRDAEGLRFPLLSDPGTQVMQRWGAYGQKTMYGRTTTGVIRSTIVVDALGVIELAKYNVKATGHVQRLRRELGLIG